TRRPTSWTSTSAACVASWRRASRRPPWRPSGARATGCLRGGSPIATRSIFSRLVTIAIALSLALLFGLWVVTDQTIRATAAGSARNAVDVDLAGLVDIHATGGREELERRIADRLAFTPAQDGAPHYLLADATGARLAGDIATWPDLDAWVSEAGTIRVGKDTLAHARATRLGSDLQLVVARETGGHGPLLWRVALVFLGGATLFVLLVGGLGRAAAGRLHGRIERINHAFRDANEERLGEMLDRSDPDEIDELAGHSAAAISRQARLVEAYRDASDQV